MNNQKNNVMYEVIVPTNRFPFSQNSFISVSIGAALAVVYLKTDMDVVNSFRRVFCLLGLIKTNVPEVFPLSVQIIHNSLDEVLF